jgi:hypothetical protein
MSHQENNEEWGCTLTANDKIRFSSCEGGKSILKEENKDEDEQDERKKLNTMPRDGRLQ